MSFLVAQLGARMHYAVPRILEKAGLLERLDTDICASKGWPRLLSLIPTSMRPARVRRLLARVPEGIPPRRIKAFTSFGLDYARRFAKARDTDERNESFLWAGREFCRLVVESGFNGASAVYTFNSAGLEILHAAKARGVKGVLEQTIAPRAVERVLLSDEAGLYPEWEMPPRDGASIEEYCQREVQEWAAADLVVCGSEFVRDGIAACGGDRTKCVVVPYGLDQTTIAPSRPDRMPGPLRVLTVGAVGLRKGSPYVLEAAVKLAGSAQFRMAGAIHVLPEAERQLRRKVELVGVVPRSQIAAQFSWADVFLLPSLCEGSATSTYEAMLHGLPVICTAETGSIVRDGIDGFLVPKRDGEMIAEKLALLAAKPDLLRGMSESARAHSADYSLEKYGERLLAAFRERAIL